MMLPRPHSCGRVVAPSSKVDLTPGGLSHRLVLFFPYFEKSNEDWSPIGVPQ